MFLIFLAVVKVSNVSSFFLCPGIAKVVLKKGKTQLFRDGSPMVYSGAVDCVIGKPPQTGDAVLVTDRARQPFAWGIYNSVSMYCVRIMQMEDEAVRYCLSNLLWRFCRWLMGFNNFDLSPFLGVDLNYIFWDDYQGSFLRFGHGAHYPLQDRWSC